MKTERFEVGKTYDVNGACCATVIARTEKTVTFRVLYAYYPVIDGAYFKEEDIVKKRIFMAGSEETSLTEFTKKDGVDFCNAHNESEDVEFFQEIENKIKYARLVELIEEWAEDDIDWLIYDESVMLETVKQHIPNVSELSEDELEGEANDNFEYIIEDYKSFQEDDDEDED